MPETNAPFHFANDALTLTTLRAADGSELQVSTFVADGVLTIEVFRNRALDPTLKAELTAAAVVPLGWSTV